MRYVVALAMLLLLVTVTPSSAQESCTPPPSVMTWQSSGEMTTEPVVITGSHWRIDVDLERQVCIGVYRIDGTRVQSQCLRQDGATHIYSGPGTYYLEISSLAPWQVRITDLP